MTNVGVVQYADDGAGNLLDPQPYALRAPAKTNRLSYSNDLTNAAWTATTMTVAKDAVGLAGQANNACTLTATSGNATVIRAATYVVASAKHATHWFIKRKTGTGTIELTLDNGSTWQDITSQINSSTYTGIAVDQTLANPQVGIRIVTSGDAVYVGNAGLMDSTSKEAIADQPPIFTTSAAVTRDTDTLVLDSSNISDTAGTLYCEVDLNGDDNIISTFLTRASGDITLDDGTTTQTSTQATGEHQIGIVWSAAQNSMRLNVDGTWETATAYDGTLLSGALDLFRTGAYVQKMRNLKIWSAASEALIDGLMP